MMRNARREGCGVGLGQSPPRNAGSPVPPCFLTILTSLRSTESGRAGSMTRRMQSTAMGARSEACWLTTLELRDVEAALRRLALRVSETRRARKPGGAAPQGWALVVVVAGSGWAPHRSLRSTGWDMLRRISSAFLAAE